MYQFFLDMESFKRIVEGYNAGGTLLHKCGGMAMTKIGDGGWTLVCGLCDDQPVTPILTRGEKFVRENYFFTKTSELDGIQKLEKVEGLKDLQEVSYYHIRDATPLERLEYLKRIALDAIRREKEAKK